MVKAEVALKGQIDALHFDPERSPRTAAMAAKLQSEAGSAASPIRAINDSRPGARGAD
jgi:hypothetical protein